ncbi:MAG: Inner membrane protein YbhN [Candidatus Hinthialibacteria bacterium OLB16]|nr:MAG: Inner membrane protein YbhN [Candidatus Hinthialibacteria bacterium OLB16]
MASSPASNKKLSVGTVVTAVIHLVMPAVFCMALWVLYKTLHHYHISDILNDLRQIPLRHLMAGGLLTVVNYWVLTTLDASAIRYAGSSLEYGKVALTSFIGYAFSHNVGLSWLSGGSIRYRLYGAWGLTGGEIARSSPSARSLSLSVFFLCRVFLLFLGRQLFLLLHTFQQPICIWLELY